MNWYDIEGVESFTDPSGYRREIYLVAKLPGADAWNLFCDGRQFGQSPSQEEGKAVCERRASGADLPYRSQIL